MNGACAKPRIQLLLWCLLAVGLLAVGANPAPAATQSNTAGSLPVCQKCPEARIFSSSGIGTAHATAEARLTYADIKSNCENYAMSSDTNCGKEAKEMLAQQAGKIYRASADCIHGKLTDIYGDSYTYDEIWTSGWIKGQSRWRDAKGKILGPEGPYGSFAIAATGAVLCPNGFGPAASKHSQ